DRLGGKNQLHRHTDTADVDQPRNSTVAVMEPAPRLDRSERAAVRSHAQITCQRELKAAGQGPPIDGGDRRFGDAMQAAGEAAESQVDDFPYPARWGADVVSR